MAGREKRASAAEEKDRGPRLEVYPGLEGGSYAGLKSSRDCQKWGERPERTFRQSSLVINNQEEREVPYQD